MPVSSLVSWTTGRQPLCHPLANSDYRAYHDFPYDHRKHIDPADFRPAGNSFFSLKQ